MSARFQENRELHELLARILSSEIVLVDGGARSGVSELERLAPHVAAFGFEPNPDEYEKLSSGLFALNGVTYRRLVYSPLALLAQPGEATLHVSKRPGATSLLRPNSDLLSHFDRDNWSQLGEIVGEVHVPGTTLASFFADEELDAVDLLKLDTQGSELAILQAAGDRLRDIGVIKTEVETVPVYEGQPLLGDVCVFLADHDFELIDIRWTDPCRRYHFSANLPPDSYRLIWADAIFAAAPTDFAGPRKLEQAIVLAELGYVDLALYIIEKVERLEEPDREALIAFYEKRRAPVARSRLKAAIARRLPPRLLAAAKALRARPQPKEVARVP
jgi:FkbM family methyltransferase